MRMIDADALPNTLRIDLMEKEMEERYGTGWLFNYQEPRRQDLRYNWLQMALSRQVLIWAKQEAARQIGKDLAGKWVKNGNGRLSCNICGMEKKLSEFHSVCLNCGAKMDAKEEEHGQES